MSHSFRRLAVRLLLWLPAAFTVIWFVNQEHMLYQAARERVTDQALHAALADGQLIQLRLLQQFQQLEFVANVIVGIQDPGTLDTRTQAALRYYIAQHPELVAINLLSRDGQRIDWSSNAQSTKPVFLPQDFTPLLIRHDEVFMLRT